jgi:rhamnulose-1-phosphate aldolase
MFPIGPVGYRTGRISTTGSRPDPSILQTNETFPVPTSELPAHLAIHGMLLERKPQHTTVIHTHATELIALTHIKEFTSSEKINKLLWAMHPETAMFVPEGTGFVPYSVPGTQEIAEATVKELENHPMVIWEKHGVFATGHSVTEAFDIIDIMSKSAKIFFMVKQSGFEPEGLPG